jgi:hypothetical protein
VGYVGCHQGNCVLLGLIVLVGCAAVPPNRLDSYLSPETKAAAEDLTKIDQRPLKAGLVLVSDTSAPGAAPNLPDEAFIRLGEE